MGYFSISDGYVIVGEFWDDDLKYDKLLQQIIKNSVLENISITDWEYNDDFDFAAMEISVNGYGGLERIEQLLKILRMFYNSLNNEDKKIFNPIGSANYYDSYGGGTIRGFIVIGENAL